MKRILITATLTLACFGATLFVACKKEKTSDLSYGVQPGNEPEMLNKSLRMAGKLVNGGLPESSGTGGGGTQVLIVSYPEAVEVNAGVELYIPYATTNDDEIVKLFVQVEGAKSYWELPAKPDTFAGSLYMKLFVPNFVQKGDFNLVFSVLDKSGSVSKAVVTNTIITAPMACGAQASGSVGITVRAVDLGDKPGILTLDYETYSIPDRIDISYNGQWVRSTGPTPEGYYPNCANYGMTGAGFVSESGKFTMPYDPANGKYAVIYITGCDGGTAWDIAASCVEVKNWYDGLPDCPCDYEAAKKLDKTTQPNGRWSDCGGANQDFHYGAKYEVRWLPDDVGSAGQQCTYSSNKQLITTGIAAGSPDKVSPGSCGFWSWLVSSTGTISTYQGHKSSDMVPWETLACWQYLGNWPSNFATCTSENPVTTIDHAHLSSGFDYMKKLIGDMNCKQATYLIRIANESSTPKINPNLRNFLLGTSNALSATDLITHLQSWRDKEIDEVFTDDDLVVVINTAITNLQQ